MYWTAFVTFLLAKQDNFSNIVNHSHSRGQTLTCSAFKSSQSRFSRARRTVNQLYRFGNQFTSATAKPTISIMQIAPVN